jgi:predicted outer membrane repeat protein
VNLTDSTLDSNTAADYGGGIYSEGTLTIAGSTIQNNTATSEGGGGVYLQAGTTTVTASTLYSNTAAYGGGIQVSLSGALTVSSSTFTDNSTTSASGGGGLITYSSTPTTISNSTFYGNSAGSSGGGIVSSGGSSTLNINNSIVAGSTGGDCYLALGTINARNSLIQDGLTCVNGTNSSNLTGDPSLGALTGDPAYYPLNSDSIAEVDLGGFHLYHQAAEGELVRLNAALIPGQNPGSPVGAVYEFLDKAVEPGLTYSYWLEAVDTHGQATRHGPVSVQVPPGGQYRIYLPLVDN